MKRVQEALGDLDYVVQGANLVFAFPAEDFEENRTCPTCEATGFQQSTLGPDRCTFCDGTEGGNPPEEDA